MAVQGTEVRRKTVVLGVRVDPGLNSRISAEAAARGVTSAELVRQIVAGTLDGRQVRPAAKSVSISSSDRALIAELNRHAGRLTGALIQTAKAARQQGLQEYRRPVEHLIGEVTKVRKSLDRLLEELSR
jgi:hypothetical protein